MQVGQMADETPVYLLGKRVIFIFGSKASLDVSDFYLTVKSSQRGGHGGRRISLNNDPIRSLGLEHFIKPHQEARCQPGQRLVFLHDSQVIIWLEVEDFEERFDHFPVLTGKTNDRLEGGLRCICSACRMGQGSNHGRQLDYFGPRAEDHQDLNLHGVIRGPVCAIISICRPFSYRFAHRL